MQVPSSSPAPAVFSFNSHEIRTIVLNGGPWFVAKDVADVLGYAKPQNAIATHCKYAKLFNGPESGRLTDSPRGITIIPESDVFRLIIKSQLPAAEKFEAWVMEEVLPAIRKTGSYGVPALPTDPMAILKLTFEALEQSNKRIEAVETDIQFIKDNVRLHAWQCKELQLAVNVKVSDFHKQTGVDYKQLYPGVWNKLKLQMHVNSYQAIPAAKFDDALAVVRAFTIRDMPDYVRAQALDLQDGGDI